MPNTKTAPRAAESVLARRENGFVDPCMAAASAAVARHCFSENSALISFLRTLGFLRKLRGLLDKLSFLRNLAFQKTQLLSAFEGKPSINLEKNLSFYQLLRETPASALRKTSALSTFGTALLLSAFGKAQLFVQLGFSENSALSALGKQWMRIFEKPIF